MKTHELLLYGESRPVREHVHTSVDAKTHDLLQGESRQVRERARASADEKTDGIPEILPDAGMVVTLGGMNTELAEKILDQTRTFAYAAAPTNSTTIPSVSASTSNHCDLGSLTGNFLDAVLHSRNAFIYVSVSVIPEGVAIFLRLYFLDD
jgi:hypothetical protein